MRFLGGWFCILFLFLFFGFPRFEVGLGWLFGSLRPSVLRSRFSDASDL